MIPEAGTRGAPGRLRDKQEKKKVDGPDYHLGEKNLSDDWQPLRGQGKIRDERGGQRVLILSETRGKGTKASVTSEVS